VDLADAYNRRSAALRQAGDYAASLDDAENAIRLSKDKPELVLQYAEALRARGNLRILQGELKEALSDFSNSAAIYKKSSLDMDVAKVLIELGWVNRRLGQYEETEKDYTQALEILQANGNAILAANVLNNLGVLQYLLGQYERAVLTLDKALQYAKIASYPRMEGYTLNSLGDLYRDLRSFQQAKAAYDQAWQVITAIQDKSLEMYQYLSIAVLERMEGNFGASAEALEKAKQATTDEKSAYELASFELESAIIHLRQGNLDEIGAKLRTNLSLFEEEGHRLEADKTRFIMLLLLSQQGLIKSGEKVCADLFNRPLSPISKMP